jgi:hypothetical protein
MASRFTVALRSVLTCLVLAAAFIGLTPKAQAAFHLWNIAEIYTNSSGTLQFIELQTNFGSQQFVSGRTISVTNLSNTSTNSFTIPSNLPGDSANRRFLLGTAGLQAAGGPAPDFIIADGFLFSAGGTINFFGANSGGYTALPTDGFLSRTWGGGNALNSPTNFAGQSGSVPAPGIAGALAVSGGVLGLRKRRSA